MIAAKALKIVGVAIASTAQASVSVLSPADTYRILPKWPGILRE